VDTETVSRHKFKADFIHTVSIKQLIMNIKIHPKHKFKAAVIRSFNKTAYRTKCMHVTVVTLISIALCMMQACPDVNNKRRHESYH
jgi:hypothetical protein